MTKSKSSSAKHYPTYALFVGGLGLGVLLIIFLALNSLGLNLRAGVNMATEPKKMCSVNNYPDPGQEFTKTSSGTGTAATAERAAEVAYDDAKKKLESWCSSKNSDWQCPSIYERGSGSPTICSTTNLKVKLEVTDQSVPKDKTNKNGTHTDTTNLSGTCTVVRTCVEK